MLHDLFKYISILYFINALNAFWKRINLIAKEVSLKYGFIDWLWLMPCATVENSQRCQVLEHDLLMRILDMRHTVPILIMSTIQNTISVWMWSRINLMSNCTFFHSDIDLLFGFASVCVCVFFLCVQFWLRLDWNRQHWFGAAIQCDLTFRNYAKCACSVFFLYDSRNVISYLRVWFKCKN